MADNVWKIFAKRTLIFEKKYEPLLVKAIQRFRSSFIDDYTTHGKDYATSRLNLVHLNPDLTEIIRSIYKTVGLWGAQTSNREIKKDAQKDGASFGRNEAWVKAILDYLNIHQLNFVSDITGTMRDDILKILQDSLDNGWSIDRTVQELQRTDLIEARARVIARTEIVRAANVGHSVGAKSSPYELDKLWSAANDHRTRHSHRDINAHITSELGTFRVEIFKGDVLVGYDEMQYPGDPNAHPSNTINCRCRVLYKVKRDTQGKPILRSSDTATIIPMQRTTVQVPAIQIAATLKANIRIGIPNETE